MRVAGIMSGTSLDGIDVAIVDVRRRKGRLTIQTLAHGTLPYSTQLRQTLLEVSNRETHTAAISRLHFLLPQLYAEAVRKVCARLGIPQESLELVGCHGQTIFHEGDPVRYLGRCVASTLQIGDGSVLAELLGIPVVSDFRPRDIAAGGRGAPLVPYVDHLLLQDMRRGRVALNIGGIANVTLLPAGGRTEDIIAFDTGPGNMVIDALVAEATDGKKRFDRGGRLAALGTLHRELLNELLKHSYYEREPPKSAGREQYGDAFVKRLLASGLPINDLIATATVLTAATIALGIERFCKSRARVDELIVSGGGAHNRYLMNSLQGLLPGVACCSSAHFGVDPDAKEAIAFAVLAYESYHRRGGNLPGATGARRRVILGKLSV